MRILLVGTCLGVGGAERVMIDLADSYAQRGHDVLLVALAAPILLKPNSPNIGVVCLYANSFISFPKVAVGLHKEISKFKPDVVHAHLFHAIILTRLLRLVSYVPRLVGTVHSTVIGGRFRKLAYRWTERFSDITTSVSEEVASHFLEEGAAGRRPFHVVHNGIALDSLRRDEDGRQMLVKELGVDQTALFVVSIGRLEAAKDYPNLLRALRLLKSGGTNCICVIAGEGSLRSMLEEKARSLGLDGRVFFLGLRRDVSLLLSAADVFVLSSAWEGLPMAVGEAMACGCAIVATDCGGVRELVADTGFLVPPRDSVLLAERIDYVLKLSIDKRRRLGSVAQERIRKNFSLDASVTRWLEIYCIDHESHSNKRLAMHD